MRWFVSLWITLQAAVLAGEMEVRSYRVWKPELVRVHWEALERQKKDLGDRDDHRKDWAGELVKVPEFQSRFFKEAGTWRDCSGKVGEIIGKNDFGGRAYFDEARAILVMKAGVNEHGMFEAAIDFPSPVSIRMAAAVYRVPKVIPGMRPIGFAKVPKGARLLGEVSVVTLPGQNTRVRSPKGELVLESEARIDPNDDIVELRIAVSGELEGRQFELKTGLTVLRGVPWVCEIGSEKGEDTLMVVVTPELLLMDGSSLDDWVLKEKEGPFLREYRLEGVRSHKIPEVAEPVRAFEIDPLMIDYLAGVSESVSDADGEPDPFAVGPEEDLPPKILPVYEGKDLGLGKVGTLFDIRYTLKLNGVAFRPGDFAVYSKLKRVAFVKASPTNLELIEGIFIHGVEFPRMIRVDLEQWGEDGRMIRKIGALVLPGQSGVVGLGGDLKAEIEAQIDAYDQILEARVTLTETEGDLTKASFQTGMILGNGVPVKVQESYVEERKTWKVTATIVPIDEVVNQYLEDQGR